MIGIFKVTRITHLIKSRIYLWKQKKTQQLPISFCGKMRNFVCSMGPIIYFFEGRSPSRQKKVSSFILMKHFLK